MWDPTRKRTPIVRELECSRDEAGHAHGTITLLPWGTRERLAYQDGAVDAMKVAVGADGKTSVRKVVPSAITLLHLRLTVVDCEGFPPVDGEPFDFGNPEHVLSLDEVTYDEVVKHATDVQPLAGSKVRKPQDRLPAAAKVAALAGEPTEDLPDSDEDPTPTRPKAGSRSRR